ncbi:hypothetical protein A1OE_130 [Candidatus Endolissoclinum faulkneri L2]|uniref:Uncharacterized protein n=1 Tax=Candidatus Endolissoclinum faulkneri L2 TaxID=1193729 RepID=K7YP06_9PROT|nr:hypothetical protein A1OE_130 [Candidatus Endolissoclinum faulkneri L2]
MLSIILGLLYEVLFFFYQKDKKRIELIILIFPVLVFVV